MAQWWECSPPTIRPGLKSRHRRHVWVWICCWLSPLLREVFSGSSGFPLSLKTNISKFQFNQESGRWRTTLWMCYLQIVIYFYYLFIYWPTMRSRLLDIGPKGCVGTPISKWWGCSLSYLGGVNCRFLSHLGCLDGKSLYLPIQVSLRAAHKDIQKMPCYWPHRNLF